GFQFTVDGATVSSASGGDAASAGLLVQSMGSTVLAFSMTGGYITPGCGTLVNLNLSGTASGLSDIVFSDEIGGQLDFTYYVENDADLVYDCSDEYPDCAANYYDCNDECGGTAMEDECGVCGGDGIPPGDCDCNGNVEDCAGVCGGSAMEDECGICGGDGIADGECDCDGNIEDCAGECGGSADFDECGVCGGDGIADGECDCNGNVEDCAGICGGSAMEDECGVCGGPGDIYECGCTDIPDGYCDCDGNMVDECGECGGDGPEIVCEDGTVVCDAGLCPEPEDAPFTYNQSTLQSFYYINTVDIAGTAIENDDWVAAFKGDLCVGARKWDTSLCGGSVCDLPVMGDDGWEGTAGYMQPGEYPTFKVYDRSEDKYYDALPSENFPWANNAFQQIETLSGGILGCTDPDACNYDPDATLDDGSCAEWDECGECGGDGIPQGDCDCNGNVEDCAGVCGGDAEVDECGVCGGDGIPQGDCDCNGNVEDCAGVCGGDAEVDECGVCGGDGIPQGDCDCNGNVEDCAGVCGG
ncbi:MAG: hypothetical protein QGF36_06790, partial [Candidatus Marinimicrobia bacterium]|nr:hypothetical protein [Candidatus Neomarinimicrobiota bacterium]